VALRDKTILITQAVSQSGELKDRLTHLGVRVVEYPASELEPVESWHAVDDAITHLRSYHWLLFTSANAVEFFMQRVSAEQEILGVQIAAIGSATAKKLSEWKLKPTLMPQRFNAEGMMEAFPKELLGVRILFPRAETAREILPEELRRRGAVVDVLPVYRTKKADTEPLDALLVKEQIDCAVFTSSSAVRYLSESLDENLDTALAGIVIAAIGPVTAKACEAFQLHVTIQPQTATIPELVEAIRSHFENF
jgi:uroporphyrinogen III methyltransferase/synthase